MTRRNIGVVLATFNRKELTLRFLESLTSELNQASVGAKIFLVDDHSSDNTASEVRKLYPMVTVIDGHGMLYWAGSVRRAMQDLETFLDDIDGILLANDDIEFEEGKLGGLVELAHTENAMVGGAVCTIEGAIEATGCRIRRLCPPKLLSLPVSDQLQKCDVLPAHVLYIPTNIYRKLGPFDEKFTHGHIDLEYSLRARRAGVPCFIAPGTTARIETIHHYQRDVMNLELSVSQLWWRIRFHPKSPPPDETIYYLRIISPFSWPIWIVPYYRGYLVSFIRAVYRNFSLGIRKAFRF